MLIENDSEVDMRLPSTSRSKSKAGDVCHSDHNVGAWHECCMMNVMIIQRCDSEVTGSDSRGMKAMRVAIGRILEGCTISEKNGMFSMAECNAYV